MLAFGRFLFAPGQSAVRVVPMSDAAAGFWLFWSSAFVGWFAFGYVTIQHLRSLGMSLPRPQVLAYLLGTRAAGDRLAPGLAPGHADGTGPGRRHGVGAC